MEIHMILEEEIAAAVMAVVKKINSLKVANSKKNLKPNASYQT